MNFDLVIKNGTVVTAVATYQADVGIQGEQIAAVGHGLHGRRELDAAGKLVIPGGIDPHVHLQYQLPNFRSADDFFTGTRAAAFGGTTTIIDFVEPKPTQTMLDGLAARSAEADGQAVIDYGFHMTIGPHEIEKLDQLPAAYAAGCASFKLYMAYGMRLTDDQLLRALQAIRGVNGLPVVHAENWDVICALVAQNLAAGRTEPHWHPHSRPPLLEAEAVSRLIDIAAYVGTRAHIFHISCAEVVERLAEAQRRGLPVTGETCPHYLLLNEGVFQRPLPQAARYICSPPLRSHDDQLRLWAALGQDVVNIVTTDHCPFTQAEKAQNLHDYSQIPGGVPGIEARLALLYSYGVADGYFSLNRWVEMSSTRVAQLFGLRRKGHIAPGYDADLVIFDPEKRVTLSTETLHENVDWTPYQHVPITGWPVVTLCRGLVVVADGEFVGERGYGRFVPRSYREV